jgi:Protein of unknown function (DUF3433)
VDYQTKLLMPWAQMRKGPSSADKTVLLDYTSPLLIVSLFKACRNLHFPVSLTIVGFVLIKILTILSTGLLVLEDVPILGSPTRLFVTNKFDAGNFSNGAAVDARPFYAVFGNQNAGVPLPMGTTDSNAVQSFEASYTSPIPSTAELVGSVDIFGADLDCEAASMTFVNTIPHWGRNKTEVEYLDLSASSTSCQVSYASFNVTDTAGPVRHFGYRSLFEMVECTDVSAGDELQRLLIAVAYLEDVNNTQRMVNSTALLCLPSYNITRGRVIRNSSMAMKYGVHVLSSDESTPRALAGLSAWDLTFGVIKSAQSVQSLDPADDSDLSLDTFLGIAFSQSKRGIWEFMNHEVMIEQSRRTFRLVTTQIAAQFLMSPIREEIEGTFNHIGSLLVPRTGPLRSMQGLFVALILVNIALLFIRPWNVLPRSAESIGGLATILARSEDALETFNSLGHASLQTLKAVTRPAFYKTTVSQQREGYEFRIEADNISREKEQSDQKRNSGHFHPRIWWRPTAFSFLIMTATLASPLAIIIALEITLQQSSKRDGLADVDPSSTHRSAWIYIPTIILVVVATLFNLLDFEVATVQPYLALKKGNITAKKSIMQKPLHQATVFALYDRLASGYLPVVMTAVAVIVAPILTIIVGGLVTFNPVPYSASINVTQITWFNTTPNLEYLGLEASNTLNLILQSNMTYPKWTYDELVFPNFTVQPPADKSSGDYLDKAEYLNVVVPAARGRFNCTPWPITNVYYGKINTKDNFSGSDIGTLNDTEVGRVVVDGSKLLLTLPDEMVGNIALADQSMNHYQVSLQNLTNQDGTGYSAFQTSTQGLLFYIYLKDNVVEDFSITHCKPFVEQAKVNVTLTLPDLVFSDAQPPMVLEDTASFFAPNPPIGNPDSSTLHTAFQTLNSSDGNAFDPFFQALVYGKDRVSAEELMNQTRLIEASEHLYRVYKAQYLNTFYRIPAPVATEQLNATYLFEQRIRVQQSELSTRLVQGILVLLLVCGVVTYAILWIDTKGTMRIVPRNPHSIASMACLLAGSDMLSEKVIPPGAEWWSDDKSRENGLFDVWNFSLGWWRQGGNDGESRFGIDVGRAVDRADPEAVR